MRRLMIAACAAAPLSLAAGAAYGQTTISGSTTTPVATASAGDVNVTTAGTINANTATPLITLNSNNLVVVDGALVSNNTDGATGVLILGGNTGSLISTTGSISLGEDYVATDTVNGDGVVEAPFATGTSKYGVRLIGSSAFNGGLNLSGAGISVKGNNSFGISLEAPLNGGLQMLEPLTVLGDGSTALRVLQPVTGFIGVSGAVSATGAGARGVDLEAAAQSLRIFNSILATGYSSTTRSTTTTILSKIQTTPLDVQQSGAAVTVAGSLGNGFFLGGAPAGTIAGSLADLDGDGVADGVEGTGSITTYGAAPALLVGASGQAITLGAVGSGDAGYGMILRGTILGSGVYDGVTATGLQIGAGGAVSIAGGVLLTGSIGAASYEADATAAHVLAGSTIPAWVNRGALSATVSDSSLTTGYGGGAAQALLVDSGATLSSLTVGGLGTITASGIGNTGAIAAVVDRSGSLSSVLNQGVITAMRGVTDSTTPVTGETIALDLRANTTGVTLVQQLDPVTTQAYGSVAGATDTAVNTLAVATPKITGDVLLGSGSNVVDLEAGSVTGALDLGSAAASLTINGGASYYGALSYSGSNLALSVNSGSLTQRVVSTLKLSSLALGSSGVLNLAVDPLNNTASLLQVSGAATVANGAKIGVQLLSAITGAQTFTLITSPLLNVASSDADLLAASSFLINASLHADDAAGTVTVTLSPRTAAQLGLGASEGSALSAVVDGAGRDAAVTAALFASSDSASFNKLYRQLLPEHGDGLFHAVDQASREIADLATDHNDLLKLGSPQGGIWMEQFLLGSRESANVGAGSETGGFGLAGGATTSDSAFGSYGFTVAYVNATSTDPDLAGDNSLSFSQFEGGLNWRGGWNGLEFGARGGASYIWGVTRREFLADATDFTSAVSRSTKGTWNAWTADARASVAYRMDFGKIFVQPQAVLDYIHLDQDAYTERFGGDGVNLIVGPRAANAASITGSVLFGGKLGQTGAVRPTFEVGVRDVFSGDAGTVNGAFAAGGSSFALSSTPITGAGGLAKVGLKYAGSFVDVEVAAKAQAFERYQEGDLKVAVSTRF